VNSSPTGIVFDPAASTTTQNPGLFYVNSTGTNQITSFNPDNGASSFVNVGINPTSLALNPQNWCDPDGECCESHGLGRGYAVKPF